MTVRTDQNTCESALAAIRKQAKATRQYLLSQRVAMVAPTCEAHIPLGIIEHCAIVLGLFDAWTATPGLLDYTRAQYSDGVYDVIAEYQAMRAAIVNLRDSLRAGFPIDVNGWVLYRSLDVNGRLVTRTFTAVQLASAIPLLDAVVASIA